MSVSKLAKLFSLFRRKSEPVPSPAQPALVPTETLPNTDFELQPDIKRKLKESFNEVIISRALELSGVALTSDQAFTFVADAIKDCEMGIRGVDLRRFGQRLGKEETKAAGLRGSVIITREFLSILNKHGKADPAEAADIIAGTINSGRGSAKALTDQIKNYGIDAEVAVIPNVNAFGPCEMVLPMERIALLARNAPLFPLSGCSHPNQCCCRYVSPVVLERL